MKDKLQSSLTKISHSIIIEYKGIGDVECKNNDLMD